MATGFPDDNAGEAIEGGAAPVVQGAVDENREGRQEVDGTGADGGADEPAVNAVQKLLLTEKASVRCSNRGSSRA